ncbi:MAG: mechanosensitive ion channel [Salinibacterium sp.]|nr:mechanosensitive ion channel [Salinibacterium sp.]
MFDWQTWIRIAIAVAIAIVGVVVIIGTASLIFRIVARRDPTLVAALARPRRRLRVVLWVAAIWVALTMTLPKGSWLDDVVARGFLVVLIAACGWFVSAVVRLFIDRVLTRYPTDVEDNRVARRIHTQMLVIQRLVTVVVAILTIAAIALTFPGAQALGASLLASAGVVSVVAGIAAQSALGNVFAGMQLAFSDAIRVDDVVVADGAWGRIEEITLTYVVLRTWDQRRVVLPSTYFTTTPFENWTRTGSELLGAVEIDVDWRVSPSQLRVWLQKSLKETDLWDGRTSNVQVTDAVGGFVRVRVVVSAANAGALWDLRCWVREQIVEWVHQKNPAALPRTRVLMVDQDARPRSRSKAGDDVGIFTGSPEAEERGQQFTWSIPTAPKD